MPPLVRPVTGDRLVIAGGTAATALTIVPRHVLGGPGFVPPSEKITLANIGCGTQGLREMLSLLAMPEIQVVAVCDVKTDQLEQARQRVNQQYQNQDCATYRDFREIVARKDIDAFLIATPDQLPGGDGGDFRHADGVEHQSSIQHLGSHVVSVPNLEGL